MSVADAWGWQVRVVSAASEALIQAKQPVAAARLVAKAVRAFQALSDSAAASSLQGSDVHSTAASGGFAGEVRHTTASNWTSLLCSCLGRCYLQVRWNDWLSPPPPSPNIKIKVG